jgi:hypothetical protein
MLFNIELAIMIFYYIIFCRLERIFKNFETLHLQVRRLILSKSLMIC